MKPCFVIGYESTRDYPGDTPEAFWRVLLPAKHYRGPAVVVGGNGAETTATSADVVWIYEPLSELAVRMAQEARRAGKPVVVDFAEDIWRRGEQDRDYSQVRLDAALKTMELASAIVVANQRLAGVYEPYGPVRVVEAALPPEWAASAPPPKGLMLGWWSDGRQKLGFESVAAGVRIHLEAGARVRHIQFAHHRPLVSGLDPEASRAQAARLEAHFADDLNHNAEHCCRFYRDLLAECTLSLECYVAGDYAETVSDVPLLRAGALGLPSLTTRQHVPPGAVARPAPEWGEALDELLHDEALRKSLGEEALAWAKTRSTYEAYDRVLKEVTQCQSTE